MTTKPRTKSAKKTAQPPTAEQKRKAVSATLYALHMSIEDLQDADTDLEEVLISFAKAEKARATALVAYNKAAVNFAAVTKVQ